MNIEENPLNDFASYTYNVKLYAITKKDYNRIVVQEELDAIHKSGNFEKKVIIAETGSTSMNITNISMTTFPTVTEGSYITNLTFDLIQTKGYSFFESIVVASMICGWEALIQDPIFILEISFKGLTDTGNINNDIYTVSYPIKLNRIRTSVSSKGSHYNITAALVYNIKRNDITTIPEQLRIENTETFGQFISAFQNALNDSLNEDNLDDGVSKPHEHKFIVSDDDLGGGLSLSDFQVSNPNSESNPIHNASVDNDGSCGFTSYVFAPNMSIPNAIEAVIATITEAQDLLNPIKNDGICTYFEIQPVVQIGDFNPETGDNSLIINWYITPEKGLKPTRNDLENDEQHLKKLLDVGRLRKRYDYYFTGLNTEVKEVDLNLDDLHYNKLAKYNNLFINKSRNAHAMRLSKVEDSNDEAATRRFDAREKNNTYKANPTQSSGTEIYYVDDVSNLNFENTRFYNKFIKQYSASTSGEAVTPENGGDSKRFDYNLSLHNIRNNTQHSMLSLNMDIRGDPYWMVPAHTLYRTGTFSSRASGTFNLIAFFMGYPNEIAENNSTSTSYRTDHMFSGLYMVIEVTSTFNNGVFDQKLKCRRLSDISASTLIKEFGNT